VHIAELYSSMIRDIPENTANIKYKVPISLALVENNQRVILNIGRDSYYCANTT
jgi:hypothetical protein